MSKKERCGQYDLCVVYRVSINVNNLTARTDAIVQAPGLSEHYAPSILVCAIRLVGGMFRFPGYRWIALSRESTTRESKHKPNRQLLVEFPSR